MDQFKQRDEDQAGAPPAPDATTSDEQGGLLDLLQEKGTFAEPAPSPKPPPAQAKRPQLNPWEEEAEWRRPDDAAADQSFDQASRLRKILDTSDTADEDIQLDLGPAKAVSTDYDSAIQAFMRNQESSISCRKHADRASVSQCPECEAYYCQACMTIRRGRMLCRDCAETLFVASEAEIIEAQARGEDAPEDSVTLESPPEFQVGAEWMGLEGTPASPVKTLFALLIDFLVVRGILFVGLLVFNAMGLVNPSVFAGFFDPDSTPLQARIISTFLLLKPLVPWLPLFAAADFLYYFLTLSFTNRSMGMSWLGCRIVTHWGEFVPFGGVALRTLVFLALGELPAVLLSAVLPRFRGPHDLMAGTMVINYAGVKRVDSYDTIQLK